MNRPRSRAQRMKPVKWVVMATYVALVVVLGIATFVGQAHGADEAARHIYHTVWFIALWAVLALAGGVYIVGQRLYRQVPLLLLHVSLLIILGGAFTTRLTGQKGTLHLRQGVPGSTCIDEDKHVMALPFSVTLRRFQIVYYPGTQAPADFVSHVTCDGQQAVISMNHIVNCHGYRLYQSSFDMDMQGTVLTVNHDPWGTGVTYAGYALLALAMALTLASRRQSFRRLLHAPVWRSAACVVALLAFCHAGAQARSIPTVSADKAREVARYQVVYNDRIVPLNTVATDFVQKIYGHKTYKGLNAEQVLYGWMARPDVWKGEKMIRIKSSELRQLLGIDGPYASLQDLFTPTGQYSLQDLQGQEQGQDALGKALRETDERVGLILMLVNRSLFTPLSPEVPHLSKARVEAEIIYNRVPFTAILFMMCLAVGLLGFVCLMLSLSGRLGTKWSRGVQALCHVALIVGFVVGLCGYGLRWYVSGRVPLSNGYETMLLLSLLIMALTLLLRRRTALVTPFGLMLAGFALLVSNLGQMNPQITPLMPVLHSPLLSLHVGIIMAAYALLAFMMLNGLTACWLIARHRAGRQVVAQLTALSRLMLYPAVFLLAAGIFLGAVWANVSWGAYWSWDPKETWALITLMVYAVPMHRHSLPWLRRDVWFHLYLALAFLTVLMTYFGVNWFMAGMHSYA